MIKTMEIHSNYILTPNEAYNMSKIIRKIQGFWICNLFSCLTRFAWVNSGNKAYEFLLNSKWSLNLQNLCNTLHLNGIPHTSVARTPSFNLQPMWFCIVLMLLHWLLFVDRSGTGTGGCPLRWRPRYRTSSARQATLPPIDLVDKNPLPYLSLMHE